MTSPSSFAYRHRGTLVAIPLIIAVLCRWCEYDSPSTFLVTGIVFALGFGIRIWAQQYLHFRFAKNMALTTGGPYSLVRNPIYIGNTLICMAVTIGSEVLWMVPITFATCCVVFTYVVRAEEEFLLRTYGDAYAEYQKRVPRWFPKPPLSLRRLWAPHYLGRSIAVEAYNLLFLVPVIIKEILDKT